MPSFCCVPNCNQKGSTSLSGEKVSFFNFPKAPLLRKQWIHTIRRDEGKGFVITERTKVWSLHFKSEDLRKSINGRIYVKEGGIPSKFDWSGPSPEKRKAPTERQPLPAKKKLLTEETVEMFAFEPSTSFKVDIDAEFELGVNVAQSKVCVPTFDDPSTQKRIRAILCGESTRDNKRRRSTLARVCTTQSEPKGKLFRRPPPVLLDSTFGEGRTRPQPERLNSQISQIHREERPTAT